MIRQLICHKSVGNLKQSNIFCDVGKYQVIPHSQHSRYSLLNFVQHFITFLSSVRIFSNFSLFFIHHSRVPNRFHKFSSSPARLLENLWNLFGTPDLFIYLFKLTLFIWRLKVCVLQTLELIFHNFFQFKHLQNFWFDKIKI